MTFYQFAINNIAKHIEKIPVEKADTEINAFEASEVLAIVFCKTKEEIIIDIINSVSKK